MAEIDCRPFQEEDWDDMVRFYEEFYGPRYIFTRREFFDWNFSSPLRPDARSGQRLMVHGRRIIGIMGSLAWPMQIGGSAKLGEYNVNLYLDPGYRGHRMGQRLLESSSSGYLYSMTNGFNEATLSMYERLGKVYHWKMLRYTKFMHAAAAEMLLSDSPYFQQLETTRRPALLEEIARSAESTLSAPAATFERVERFGDEWDTAWDSIRREYGFTTWRSSAFYNWRYIDYPYPLYECYVARRGGKIECLVALRAESPPFGCVVRVVDLVSTPEMERDAFAFVEGYATKRRAVFIDYILQGKMNAALLQQAGYARFHDRETGAQFLPMDFNPLRHRDAIPILVTFMDRTDPAISEIENGTFYFVKGDSDQDRAN